MQPTDTESAFYKCSVEFPELTERLNWKEQINDKMVLDFTDIDFASEYKVIGEEIRKLGLTMTQRPD